MDCDRVVKQVKKKTGGCFIIQIHSHKPSKSKQLVPKSRQPVDQKGQKLTHHSLTGCSCCKKFLVKKKKRKQITNKGKKGLNRRLRDFYSTETLCVGLWAPLLPQ